MCIRDRDTGRKLVTTALQPDERGIYRYDMADMEQVITENSVKLFIMCSPHNPVAVSYTHLDVYKRQVQGHPGSGHGRQLCAQ